jgi:heptosyltransferase-2/heptosyltransferase-3
MTASPAPPLVVRFGAFGDMVLMTSLLEVLRRRYGQRCELVSSGPWTVPLMGFVDTVAATRILYSRKGPYLLNPDQWRLVRWLRGRAPGPVYVCETDGKTHELLRRGGVDDAWICTRRDFPLKKGEHYIGRYHRLASATPRAWTGPAPHPAPVRPPAPQLRLTAEARQDCEQWLARRGLAGRPLVLVQAGNRRNMRWWAPAQRGSNVKWWPEARWAEVIRGVRKVLPQAAVLICGSSQERGLGDAIQALGGAGAHSVAGELPIPRLLALQAIAHSMISVDTGPAHSAAALGCPLVVMFATANTAMYGPSWAPADARVLVPASEGLDQPLLSLQPEQVVDAWRSLRRRAAPALSERS